ncbi:MAG: helix-turn-helix domain-containing protein, partial [Pseudomonadota bacterium]|nr:helix-turn-helix domain-containing protein [Pseudomonadota bacterium]
MSRSAHATAQSTKDRLIHAASDLFRRRGYAGVGIAEILNAAGAPKGSLYHHFPNGKADLALATADWASDGMLKLMAVS